MTENAPESVGSWWETEWTAEDTKGQEGASRGAAGTRLGACECCRAADSRGGQAAGSWRRRRAQGRLRPRLGEVAAQQQIAHLRRGAGEKARFGFELDWVVKGAERHVPERQIAVVVAVKTAQVMQRVALRAKAAPSTSTRSAAWCIWCV